MKIARSCAAALVFLSIFAGDVSAQFSPPTSGLVAWWRGEGDAIDSSGNGHNGSLFFGVGFNTGRFGQTFSLQGNLNRIYIPDATDFRLTNSLSICAWVFPKADSWIVIYRGGRSLTAYQLGMDDAGNFAFFISGSTGNDQLSVPITYNQWKQVTGTLDGSTGEMRLYFDGLLVAHKSTTVRPRAAIDTNPPPPVGIFIGNATDGGFPFIGLIDEVLLYSRALSAAEVQGLVSQGAPFIISQSTDQTVAVGDSALFRVSASGEQPLSYQWSLGGSNLAGATTSSLNLTNVQLSQAGNYSVQVTNSLGAAGSAPAVLSVNTQQQSYVALQPGLVGWWRGEGNGNDSSGNGHDGTLRDGGGYAAGDFGRAFSFLGNHNRLVVPDSEEFNLTNSLTLAAWIYINANSYAIIQRSSPTFSRDSLGLDAAGHVVFGLNSGQAGIYAPIANNQWKHVAATLDGTTGDMRLYIDGFLAASQTTSVRPALLDSSQQPLVSIGNIPYGGGFPFIGLIDEALVYSRALSSQEVQILAHVPPTPPFITSQPVSQTVSVGGTAAFSVVAGGTPPLSYQWLFKGAALTGATSSSLTISNAQGTNAGTYAVLVTNAGGTITSSNATLTVNFPTAIVRVLSITNVAGSTVPVSVILTANGNETALGFSLNFSPSLLSYADTALGSGATGATLLVNTNQTTVGSLGIALSLPAGVTFAPGDMQVVLVSFAGAVQTNDVSSVITFGDSPITRQLADVNGNAQPVNFVGGTVTLTANEFEGDVSPRPTGDKRVTVTDWVLIGRFAANLDSPASTSEFRRADCAPRSTLGNGSITVSDWVQAGRYAAGFDPLTPAGGSTGHLLGGSRPGNSGSKGPSPERRLQVVNTTMAQGQPGSITINLRAQGDENALGFSVSFNPSQFSFVDAILGSGAASATLNVNTNEAGSGRLAAVLSLPSGTSFPAGTREVLKVRLQPSVNASGSYALSLLDQPVFRETSDAAANTLETAYIDGLVTVNPSPSLTISQDGVSLTLKWPDWASSYTLQEATDALSAAQAWSNLSATQTVVNGEVVVVLPAAASPRFYRLYKP